MHTVILYGGANTDTELAAIHDLLTDTLAAGGATVESLRVADMKIHPCVGCFGCWLKTPGECLIDDDGRTVARALVQCDLRVFLTPVSFGGYGGVLKTAVDRVVPTISPLFVKVNGEMHHRLRYPNPPSLLAVGWQRQPNPAGADIFAQLVQRNAINMHAPASGSLVLTGTQTTDEQRALLTGILRQVGVAA